MEWSCEKTSLNEESRRIKVLQTQRLLFDRTRINLESHQLIYLSEPGIGSEDKLDAQMLRNMVDYTRVFVDVEACQHYLENTCDTTTFLICSNRQGERLVPEIHQRKNIHFIYIHCENSRENLSWTSKFEKVGFHLSNIHVTTIFLRMQIVTATNIAGDILIKVKQNVENYMIDERKTFSASGQHQNEKTTNDKSTDESGTWFLGFIDIICHLPYPDNYFSLFTDVLKEYYAENEAEIRMIENFKISYKPHEALSWYTRPTFLYRIMNKGLRQHKIEQTFLFGFFIQDIYRQLQLEHETFTTVDAHITKVFRGQIMHIQEIHRLSPCENIVMNSFLSTTKDRSVALLFLDSMANSDNEFQRVFIEIDLPTTIEKEEVEKQKQTRIRSRPFADISHLSSIEDESEILFMIGTLFIVRYFGYNEKEKLWTLKLVLNYDNQVKNEKYCMLLNSSPRRILKNCLSSLPTFPFAHTYMKEDSLQMISNIFTQLKTLYPNEIWIEGYELWYVAKHQSKKGIETPEDHTSLINTCNSALSYFIDNVNDDELNCSLDIANIHFEIGCEYECVLKLTKASSANDLTDQQALVQGMVNHHYDQAIPRYESALEKAITIYDKIQIFSKLVSVFSSKYYWDNTKDSMKNLLVAAEYKKKGIEEMRKCNLFDNLSVAKELLNLSVIYDKGGMIDEATSIRVDALHLIPGPFNYTGLLEAEFYSTFIIDNLIYTYTELKHDYSAASKYLQIKYQNILRKTAADPKCLTKDYHELATQYLKIGDFDTAAQCLKVALRLCKDSNMIDKARWILRIEEQLADVYAQNLKYREAYEHLFEALTRSEEEKFAFQRWSTRKILDTHKKLASYSTHFDQNELANKHLTQALELCHTSTNLSAEEQQTIITNIQEQITAILS